MKTEKTRQGHDDYHMAYEYTSDQRSKERSTVKERKWIKN